MDAPRLPAPRALLTALITTLTSSTTSSATSPINLLQAVTKQLENPSYHDDASSNSLKSLLSSQRAILSTLHVLLPAGVLLQSLDLLDRGQVIKISELVQNREEERDEEKKVANRHKVVSPQHLKTEHQNQGQGQVESEVQARDGKHQSITANGTQSKSRRVPISETKEKARMVAYQVRSSQALKSRFKDIKFRDAGSLAYTVRLESWNCSCAAFAFESFPAYSAYRDHKSKSALDESDEERDGHGDDCGSVDHGKEHPGWEFGGLSCDGRREGHVPVCKHLIACLLAEKWEIMGSYMTQQAVGREEMAGMCWE